MSFSKKNTKKKLVYAGLEEEFVNFQFSVFKMGPARSLFLLGHFASWLWVLGALYVFSNVRMRRCLGCLSLMRLCIILSFDFMVTWDIISRFTYYVNVYSAMGFSAIVLLLNYRRLSRRIREKEKQKQKEKEEKEEEERLMLGEDAVQIIEEQKKVDKKTVKKKCCGSDPGPPVDWDKFIEEKQKQYEVYKRQKLQQEQEQHDKKNNIEAEADECKKRGFWVTFYDRIVSYPNFNGE